MAKPEKISRHSFLYTEADGRAPAAAHAQCASCVLFDPDEMRCEILGPDVVIDDPANASCNYHVPGAPQSTHSEAHLTPDEAGFVERAVQCGRCFHYDAKDGDCDAYEEINKAMPDLFALDVRVSAHGCCSLQTPKKG